MRRLVVLLAFLAACSTSKGHATDAGDGDDDGPDAAEVDAGDDPPPCPEVREAVEHTCDGLDNDCDGTIDNVANPPPWFTDHDGDGAGGALATRFGCAQPEGFVAASGDCNDSEPTMRPGHEEWCDGLDNDCSGEINDSCQNGCQVRVRDDDGRRYLFCSSKVDYPTAKATCTASGFKLVRIDDEAENTWIRTTANPIDGGSWWIAGNDQETDGTWIWEDGAQFWQGVANGTVSTGMYAHWNGGEPNNDNNEDCGEMRGDGTWNDNKCGATMAFVCERYSVDAQ